MKNTQDPGPRSSALPLTDADALEALPDNLEALPDNLEAPSPWLDFWRKIFALTERLDAKEAGAMGLDAKEAEGLDAQAEMVGGQ